MLGGCFQLRVFKKVLSIGHPQKNFSKCGTLQHVSTPNVHGQFPIKYHWGPTRARLFELPTMSNEPFIIFDDEGDKSVRASKT